MILPLPEEITHDMFRWDEEKKTLVLKNDVPEEIKEKYNNYLKEYNEMRKKYGFKPKIKKRGSDGKG